MRASKSIQLMFLGSALAIVGCGEPAAKAPCPVDASGNPIPGPDGTINPNCTKGNSNRTAMRTGGMHFIPIVTGGGGGTVAAGTTGSTTVGIRPGTGGASSTKGGFSTGGFGRTGGSVGGSSAAS